MPLALEPAPRISLSEAVLDRLLASIREGTLQPGQRLPTEANLSAMLGVGRSSVREALRVLVFMGVIESKPGRGSIVTLGPERPVLLDKQAFALHRSAMLDLYEVRCILEGGAAALAAERATSGDMAVLDRTAKAVERRVLAQSSYFQENVQFHLAIAQASHNNVLFESLKRLLGQVREFRKRLTDSIQDLPARDVAEHRAILAAIRARNGRRAQALMTRHIETTIRAVRRRRDGGVSPHSSLSGPPKVVRRRMPDGLAPR
jgi:GntR family transcriptional repressor for pyruvate dehydrogenase complex